MIRQYTKTAIFKKIYNYFFYREVYRNQSSNCKIDNIQVIHDEIRLLFIFTLRSVYVKRRVHLLL